MMTVQTQIVWWIIFMILSAFFSGMEVAFVSSDKLRYAVAKKNTGPYNFILNFIYGHPRQFMATLAVGNLIVLILFVYFTKILAFPVVEQHITQNIFLSYLLIIIFVTLVILFTGEFFPRAVCTINPNLSVKLLAIPAFIFFVFLYPITKFFVVVSRSLLKIFGVRSNQSEDNVLGRVDLDSYVKQGIEDMEENSDVDSEVKIFRNALDFSSMKLRDCMVPRADIVAVNEDTDLEALKEKFIETGMSRILVYREDIDDIIGYIHIWELFNSPDDWTNNVASISFVPESMLASKMMSELMQQRKSIAVVVDEFGGTSGIITMEDLVEEIFGDIEDEYDVQSQFIKKENEKEYILSGRVEIDHLNETYNLEIPESDEYSTVAGYLLHHTQRFPKTYETIIIGTYTFKILKVTARKIEVVKLVTETDTQISSDLGR